MVVKFFTPLPVQTMLVTIMLMLSGAGSKTARFEKIHQAAQDKVEQAKLNNVPFDDLEAECYAELAISSKGTNVAHTCRAVLKLIEEARSSISDYSSQIDPAPKTTSDEPPPEQPLTKSQQIYADRLKYRLEMGESQEEAHARAASEAQAHEMLIDLGQELAEKGLLDEFTKKKKRKKNETKEADCNKEDGS
ncbi:hypothetical protein ACMFMG_006672 [Clarireedia jacksonii]